MANGHERFIDVACELLDEKSPSEIRCEELTKLVVHQTIDMYDIITDPLVEDIFNDPKFWSDGQ